MKKIISLSFLILSFLSTLTAQNEKINWITIDKALLLNQQSPKKILVDVYTDWCGWCKVMDNNTFSDSAIINYVNNNYYAVKLNAEQKEDITIGNQTYKFVDNGRRGYHELAALLLNNQLSFPSTVFIDENSTVIHVRPGYLKPSIFDTYLKYFTENHYTKVDFPEFASNYQSKVVDPTK
jgi:thioredoxin-related protein